MFWLHPPKVTTKEYGWANTKGNHTTDGLEQRGQVLGTGNVPRPDDKVDNKEWICLAVVDLHWQILDPLTLSLAQFSSYSCSFQENLVKRMDVAKVWEASLHKATKMTLRGSKGAPGTLAAPRGSKFFHFHAVEDQNCLYFMLIFREILTKLYVGSLWGSESPPLPPPRESWIRACKFAKRALVLTEALKKNYSLILKGLVPTEI